MEKSEIDLSIFSEALGVDVTRKTRKRVVAAARFVVFKKLSQYGFTWQQIGGLFGLNHPAVSYGIKEVSIKLSIGDKLVTEMWNKVKDLKI